MSELMTNKVFEDRVRSIYGDNSKKQLELYKQFVKESKDFLRMELKIDRTGKERILTAQKALRCQFNISDLLSFVFTTKINVKRILNKEESDFKLAMEIIKKDYEDKFKSELSQMKTKKEKDEFIGLLLDSNEDYAKKKEAIDDIRFTEEAFKIESENLERVKKTLEEFIMLLKKEV